MVIEVLQVEVLVKLICSQASALIFWDTLLYRLNSWSWPILSSRHFKALAFPTQRRHMLCQELQHFGAYNGQLQLQLDSAYGSFVGFCRRMKLHHSQPPFTVRMEP